MDSGRPLFVSLVTKPLRNTTMSVAPTILPTLLPMIMMVAMRRAEARIHRQLLEARAFTAESAIPLTLRRSIDKRRLQGLIRGGAVWTVASDRYFLDTDGWSRYQDNRRRRVLFALAAVAAIIGIAIALILLLS